MTAPVSADVRGGIRNWLSAYGNLVDGDCVVAAFEQLEKCHNVQAASTWKKILYRLGFKVPTTGMALADYTDYLATLDEKPGPTMGIDPEGFFAWAKSTGRITDWGIVLADASSPLGANSTEMVKEAMIAHRGCLIVLTLTEQSYVSASIPGGRWVTGVGSQYQPNPKLQHAIALVEYNTGWLACVTWGFLVYLSPSFFAQCVSGCYWFE